MRRTPATVRFAPPVRLMLEELAAKRYTTLSAVVQEAVRLLYEREIGGSTKPE